MFFSSRALLAVAFSLTAGCAGSRLDTQTASSADGGGYALRYADGLDAATRTFAADSKRAHDLTSGLLARAREVKPGGDTNVLLRVVDESDRAGRGESYARTQTDERALRAFWDDERGPLSTRVSSAAQTEVHAAGCTQQVELGGSVQHALRDGIDKQLERRTRAANEGQRTLEQHKAKLAPSSVQTVQRLSDEIALASHLVHVALVSDVRELSRLLGERRDVDATLSRMLDEERAIQAASLSAPGSEDALRHKPSEQKQSQERVVQIESSRAALAPKVKEAESALQDHREQLERAQKEYASTIEAIKASFREPQAAPPAPTAAVKK